ncbi:SusC/RagA family TonB-linked outer membrane protein [Aquirufa antheringensis]|uniref:TonB-dependent receptor n=1 Tax=Aquirufa antheringensis TaxID=2516559 RepID=A0A4Q9BFK4_9BACT|nr:TonB-dependent receptor [Aquirufa antheringensis]MCZ2484471.1 TonB-dependent receptor [Aquirufa antheringensis]MCZ2487660.1 TonB-dependent receptor [Aquirufa antheringensis]TBH74323.1 TonB-dependent receptor [Aquirufa antheringensis]
MKNNFYQSLRSFLLLAIVMLGSFSSFAQDRKVTGKVSGTDSQGIPGVSILVKGTNTGATTDVNGAFSVTVKSATAVLNITAVGYKSQSITVGSQSSINVTLAEDNSQLDEVIVTGYSVTNKKESTAAASIVKAKDLQIAPSGNVEQQLQGRVAGVTLITNGQPGTASIIRVRGFGAFGGNEPLYVVDGVPVGTTDFLSPDDIESTTVLKDAAAASIYGARAANGVIVYTTKRGSRNKGITVTYDGLYGGTDPNVGGVAKMLTPQEQADWTHVGYRNNAAANGTAVAYTHPQYGTSAQASLPTYLHFNGANGVNSGDMAAAQAAYAANPLTTFVIKTNKAGTNWYDEITRFGSTMRHSLGIQGGTDKGRFYLGLSGQEQQGILIENDFKRYSARFNSEFDLGKKVRVGENLQFTYRSVRGQAGGNNGLGVAGDESVILSAYRMPTAIPVYDEFGSFASTKAAGFNNPRNPVRQIMRNNSKDNNYNASAFGNVYVEYEPIKDLIIKSSLGGNYSGYGYKDYNFKYLGDSEPEASDSFGEGSGYNFAYTFTNTAAYKTKWRKHGLNALIGMEALNTGAGRQISGSGINPFSMDTDFVTLSSVQSPVVNSGLYSGVNFYSLFSKLDYNFNEKYYVTGVVRRDGSSRFGSENRYGIFPAVSAAWRVTSEEFMKDLPAISDLKIRGGWGLMGNSNNVDPANQFSLYAANRGNSFYPIDGQSSGANEGYFRSRIGNPAAKWETSETMNIGFDATLYNGKWEIVLDVWRKDTRDLLFNVPLPAVVGPSASAPSVNVAKMRNQGIDFQIINRGNITSDLKYELTLNNSFLKNEIVAFAPGITNLTGGAFRGITPVRMEVGRSLSSFYGYQVIGYFNSAAEVAAAPAQDGKGLGRFRYADINGDGKITTDDRTFLGSPVPTYTGGINVGLTYKDFEFATYLYASAGNKIWNQSKWFTDFFGTFEGSGKGERAKQSWTPELGNSAAAPIWESASNMSTSAAANSWYVENGDYLRIQNVSLGYNIPKAYTSKLGIKRAKFTLSANNILTLTKYKGLDPGVGGAADTGFGIDVGNYPVTRSFNASINLTF